MRKPPSFASQCLVAAVLCVALAACKPAQDAAAPAGDAAAAGSGAGDTASAPSGQALDGDLVASTNEPFWAVTVSATGLVLSGIESQRSLAVASSKSADGTRTVVATDAAGKAELTVTAKECQDSMSGAMFPFAAVLAIDGGAPINGCARPASMPPPGEGM
ncbi:hypothetical protein [Pseudoxanthomonas koreensis]|uniref:hypothetical protein n=1 Tax=Pseudoxanthomonas koreensis TaxID=266061 RepID=UPI0013915C30|nr:hypothetical protein [Pseudoxanthomonas koreensis]